MTTTRQGRWGALLLVAALSFLTTSPAAAHSALIGSNPEPDSTIQQMPEDVELEFNESVSDISPAVVLRRDGETVAELDPVIDGSTVTAASPDDLTAGHYAIVWRVVSGDGHPIDGTIPFTLEGEADQEPQTEPTAEADQPEATSEAETEAAAAESDAGTTAGLVVAAVVAAAVLGALAWLLWRRRQDRERVGADEPTEVDR